MAAMTDAARKAYRWAAQEVRPDSIWRWQPPQGAAGEVVFTILDYEVIGHATLGCTYQLKPAGYMLSLNGGQPHRCNVADLPGWFGRALTDPGIISALLMKRQVNVGRLRKWS